MSSVDSEQKKTLDDQTDNCPVEERTMVLGPAASQGAARARKASLVVLGGWEIGREIELAEHEHVVGRSFSADTRVDSPSVSREHAKIACVQEGGASHFAITDLGSSNGTRVNGALVESTRLDHGDKIQMGDILFKFVLRDEADARFYQDVHRLIHYDQLTGLLTMDAFRRQLMAEMRKSGVEGHLTIAMTDLDGLKRVNDTYGHLAGRMVVREMGVMMRHALRDQDLAALYGGDEAVILFPGTGLEQAREIAEALRRTIAERIFEHHGQTFQVTISQGLSEWPRHGRNVEELIAAADAALYAAKASGRNCVRCAAD